METNLPPVPASAPENPWKISGGIRPAPIGPLYQLGAALTAFAMLLLPTLYLGIVGGVGWLIYEHAVNDTSFFEERGASRDAIFGFIVPIVVGAIVIVFMVKPLFARRRKPPPLVEITREQQPRLFAFIDSICALVRSPRPRRVLVDLQVNASAGFSREFGSLLRRNLTLTIGLPLVTGMTVRQLGGVLAHEFGHFAQGAGMRLTYVIRTINAWFARLVYERDSWDEFLRDAARRIDIRIGIVFHLARLMVWLTRKILWVFMWLGHGISCFMLRQMEFDADYYETQVAGSEGFGQTAAALRLIGAGWQRALGRQQDSFSAHRLVNDLPGFVALETQRVPADLRAAMDKAAGEAKTGWFDTHPSDRDRVRAATGARAAGVLAGEAGAAAIFDDFSTVAQQATTHYYQHQCNIDLQQVQLLPLEAVAGEALALAESEKVSREYYHGLLTFRTLLVLSPGDLHRAASLEELAIEWRAACERQAEILKSVAKPLEVLVAADRADLRMDQADTLLQAGFKIAAKEFNLPKPTAQAVRDQRAGARLAITQRQPEVAPALQATCDRLVAALRAYFIAPAPAALNSGGAAEVERLVRIVSRLDTLPGSLLRLRNLLASFELLLRNCPKEAGKPFYQTWRHTGTLIGRETADIVQALTGLEYPFDHAQGQVKLVQFLMESTEHPDESVAAFLRGQAVLDRLFTLYSRITSRLAQFALEAERTVLAEPAPGPAVPGSTDHQTAPK
jgi:Zn-dependent protease with chaperone function